jgi:diketogulonate reductase-like aldo/keto reductase
VEWIQNPKIQIATIMRQESPIVSILLMLLFAASRRYHAIAFSAASRRKYPIRPFTSSRLCSSTMNVDNSIRNSLINCPKIPMRNGLLHPAIGFGTYKVGYVPPSSSEAAALIGQPQRSAVQIMMDALAAGYRFLECAEFYNNEAEIGQAILDSAVQRSDLFLCSKVWTTTIEKGPAAVRAQLDKTLADLRTDYLDLYLIHWPVPVHHVTAYKTLIELRNEGKIRGIGVSNYAWEDYLELKNDPDIADSDLPLVNQIEINPFLFRSVTIQKFRDEGVVLQSYRSLRDGKAMADPTLQALASQYQKTPAQILGRWCVQHGFVYTPKSAQVHRMLENAAVFDFELTAVDMATLDALTTPQALDNFRDLYRKCVNRDTSKDGTMEGVKMDITIN